jgi:hypothetical protein
MDGVREPKQPLKTGLRAREYEPESVEILRRAGGASVKTGGER